MKERHEIEIEAGINASRPLIGDATWRIDTDEAEPLFTLPGSLDERQMLEVAKIVLKERGKQYGRGITVGRKGAEDQVRRVAALIFSPIVKAIETASGLYDAE